MSWRTTEIDGEIHVIPVKDALAHESVDCGCMPVMEAVERDDGSYGWLVTHNAWDDRKE